MIIMVNKELYDGIKANTLPETYLPLIEEIRELSASEGPINFIFFEALRGIDRLFKFEKEEDASIFRSVVLQLNQHKVPVERIIDRLVEYQNSTDVKNGNTD